MNIHVIPDRCIRASDDLRQTRQGLLNAAVIVEDTAASLGHSDDESMQLIAGKLYRIADNMKIKARVIYMMAQALEKTAALYRRTEESVCDHEDSVIHTTPAYATVDLKAGRSNVKETFNKL